jgi:hypothetical protein
LHRPAGGLINSDAAKRNPLNLNPLQLKTLTLLQALALLPDAKPGEAEGSVR